MGGLAVGDIRLPARPDRSLWCLGGIVNAGLADCARGGYTRHGLLQMGVSYPSAGD
jgi:hypothetical protein